MLKKTVTYEDPFTGTNVTEDLYFNLTRVELIEMEVSVPGESLQEHLQRIAEAENGQQIMDAMKWIIFKAYGKRTENGKFIKNDTLREEFESSEAYSTLFMEMVTDADAAIAFVNGIIPKGLDNQNQEQLPIDRPNLTGVPKPEPREITRAEAVEMDHAVLSSGLADGSLVLKKETTI